MSENILQEATLEEVFKELDQILAQMESGELPLDKAFAMYEQGVAKVKQCNEKLDLIEKKMLELNSAGEVKAF
ncbi:MAG: exodeoxyribonuclease VII small subunit [Eubacterium sp.]|nr:exodeoxyribonuclease VII small subunit [Eubacterium sp.]